MSFFDKFFRHKICSNKTENELKLSSELLKSSNLFILKEQIRFVLFRECDKRGRKLLFDSNAIEKITWPSKVISNSKKSSLTNNIKYSDYIEITATHGYKYKKPSDDTACLGEMIFGSVAMTYKGENSCKIHKIPSPKKLMFTTIVHAPLRCHIGTVGEYSSESSSIASVKNPSNFKETSSSDSKLLKSVEVVQKCSSTYPCAKNTVGLDKLVQCCDVSSVEKSIKTSSHLTTDNVSRGFDNLLINDNESNNSGCVPSGESKLISDKVKLEQDILIFNISQKNSGCEQNSSCNTNSAASIISYDSENVSSVSGSLSSLRRRWAQSNSTSLDTTSQEDITSTPGKKKTKLGMALVLDISSSNDDEMETFLFNHTILIDSIMNKLQSSVESAYIKNQNFVDVIYTAFLDAQQSIYDFITGEKYKIPFWIAMLGDSEDVEADNKDDVEASGNSDIGSGWYKARDLKFSLKPFYYSPVKLKKTCNEQVLISNAKIKFLNEFHDVLVRFDTKDTNFFISTLLTAVLTHHLSWVTAIAETDSPNRHERVQSVIKNYNPIWAQLNDLCGLLGSPLKYAKTIVKGSESKKCYITAILQILTYFIRCFNVVENVYDVDIENIIGKMPSSVEVTTYRGGFDPLLEGSTDSKVLQVGASIVVNVSNENENESERSELSNSCRLKRGGLGQKKVSSACLNSNNSASSRKIYPDITDLIKNEMIYESDLEFLKIKEANIDAKTNQIMENAKKTHRPVIEGRQSSEYYSEEYLSPDEGYDTIDSSKADTLYSCPVATVESEVRKSSVENAKSDIVFLLGNEKLVNLRRSVAKTGISTNIEDSKERGKESKNVPLQKISRCNKTYPTLDCHSKSSSEQNASEDCGTHRVSFDFMELTMPGETKPSQRKCLGVSSVLGGVNRRYNSEQILQGLVDPDEEWEENLQKDLYLCAHNSTVEKNISEAICIVGDVDSWEVTVRSSNTSVLDKKKSSGVRVVMSQLVADMLESFLAIHKINLSPNFCLMHIEKKLREIYLKSKTVAELLISTDLCTIDYLTTRLDVGINDIPLLLSAATTHSPQISEKYGLSFT